MTITLDKPTRRRLEERAKKEGRKAEEIAAALVAESLAAEPVEDPETTLLRTFSTGLPAAFWNRKGELDKKASTFTLTSEEHAEYTHLLTRMEGWQVERLEAVVALAQLKGETPEAVMQRLGILPA